MLYFSPAKMIAILVAVVAAFIFALPNFFEKQTVDAWPDWLPRQQLKLGLDLRGGAHLLLTMDTKELRQNMLENLREDVRANLREAKIGTVGTGLTKDGVRVRIGRPTDMPAALKSLVKVEATRWPIITRRPRAREPASSTSSGSPIRTFVERCEPLWTLASATSAPAFCARSTMLRPSSTSSASRVPCSAISRPPACHLRSSRKS